MQLPDDFIQLIRPVFGEERFTRFLHALDEESPVSIRLNPTKIHASGYAEKLCHTVPWCRNAFYLSERPNFTFDPLLHAGCYYVQEASSMFLDEVLRQHLPPYPVMALDLCAAPGGKSTLMRSALPADSVLYSNEPIPKRASILLENVEKWGYDQHFVTNCYPKDYRKSKMSFDVILCDVPCSGEGMFRKDPDSIKEWSLSHVQHCQQLQRDIVSDAWQCLTSGGLFIYSTCTYNTKEDEENVRWMIEELGAEPLSVDTKTEWGITGSLLDGFTAPVCRFIPGYTRGEGLFMAVMRKSGQTEDRGLVRQRSSIGHHMTKYRSPDDQASVASRPSHGYGITKHKSPDDQTSATSRPSHGHGATSPQSPLVELSYPQAIAYLRGEALTLSPDVPRGIVTVAFKSHPLGQAKNIGNRANNLYPKEWRIRTTHVPNDYQSVLSALSLYV